MVFSCFAVYLRIIIHGLYHILLVVYGGGHTRLKIWYNPCIDYPRRLNHLLFSKYFLTLQTFLFIMLTLPFITTYHSGLWFNSIMVRSRHRYPRVNAWEWLYGYIWTSFWGPKSGLRQIVTLFALSRKIILTCLGLKINSI